MADWALQDAKAKFSEVVDRAQTEGPQSVSRHGKPAAVIVSAEEWRSLGNKARDREFVEFLLTAPTAHDFDRELLDDGVPLARIRPYLDDQDAAA